METRNGTSKENTGKGCNPLCSQDEQEPLGESGTDGHGYGSRQSSRLTEADSERTDPLGWKLVPVRDTTAGKILERIESLETRHINYVESHESRLRARLQEDKIEKEEFLTESNQIKSDIYHLAIAQQKASENGHTN